MGFFRFRHCDADVGNEALGALTKIQEIDGNS